MRAAIHSACTILFCLQAPAQAASATADEKTVQIVPALMMTEADAARLKEVNKLLHERQQVVDKIIAKEGLKRLSPQLPSDHMMSENSVQALLNQLDYTTHAGKNRCANA